MTNFEPIYQHIADATGQKFNQPAITSVGGGSINSAYRISDDNLTFFLKVNRPELADMFEAEAQGLTEMAATKSLRIPEVICYGATSQHSYLVLEYIECRGFNAQSSQQLGEQLAQMHRVEQPYYGWHIDNTIGSTPQINTRENDWLIFWQQQRIGQQLHFAKQNGYGRHLQDKGEALIEVIPNFYTDMPKASLLHGDLWSGNASADDQGNAVIFDPACYYGDREADIAMTELFGGFSRDFYDAYNATYPLDSGYQTRKNLYNLYHIINHLNLFGGGYLAQSENMIDSLLAEQR